MWKKIFVTILCILSSLALTACGNTKTTDEPNDNRVEDKSVIEVEEAVKGSDEELSGKYEVEDLAGCCYVFDEEGAGIILQNGSYQNGDEIINLKYDYADEGSEYGKEKTGNGVELTTRVEGADSQNSIMYEFVSGEDGLIKEGYFAGIYKIAGSNDSRIAFQGDGTFDYIQDFTYVVDGKNIVITQNGVEATYVWKAKDGKILLKSGDRVVTKLVPATADNVE